MPHFCRKSNLKIEFYEPSNCTTTAAATDAAAAAATAAAARDAADFCSNGSSTRFFEQNLFRLTGTKKFAAMAIFNLLSSSRKKDFYDEVGKFQLKRFIPVNPLQSTILIL